MKLRVVAVVSALAVVSSCRDDAPRRKAPLPRGAPVVIVSLREYRFSFNHQPLPAGRVVFRFVNRGKEIHRPSLFPLAEDFPPLDEQLKGKQRRPIAPFASIYNRRPGASGTFAVDLRPGQRYGFVCFAPAADGEAHALKGMNFEFRAGGT